MEQQPNATLTPEFHYRLCPWKHQELRLLRPQGKIQQAMARMEVWRGTALAIGLGLGLAGCGVSFAPLPAGSVAGRAGIYDYSPSVIQTGNLQQIWWCGSGYNPTDTTQFSDTIQYESIDLSTQAV